MTVTLRRFHLKLEFVKTKFLEHVEKEIKGVDKKSEL